MRVVNRHLALKDVTLVYSFFSSCGGLRFLRMDSPRNSVRCPFLPPVLCHVRAYAGYADHRSKITQRHYLLRSDLLQIDVSRAGTQWKRREKPLPVPPG